MKSQLLLDMDGVLVDFVGGCSRAHGRESPYEHGMGRGEWDMAALWKISDDEFWEPTNSYDFWFNLEKTREADAILGLANSIFGTENVAILSSPSSHPECIEAKIDWLDKHYPQFDHGKRVVFTYSKGFVAGPNRFLIDDRDKNIKEFNAQGGNAIYCPRPWNKMWTKAESKDGTWEYIKMKLER